MHVYTERGALTGKHREYEWERGGRKTCARTHTHVRTHIRTHVARTHARARARTHTHTHTHTHTLINWNAPIKYTFEGLETNVICNFNACVCTCMNQVYVSRIFEEGE